MRETIYKKVYEEGQLIGSLIFLSRIPPEQKGDTPKGKFRCSCGKEFITRIYGVETGHTKSCGCLRPQVISQPKTTYTPNQKVGDLIFLNRVESPSRSPKANFLCSCGKHFVCRIQSVKSLTTKSCGCKKSEFNTAASTKYKPTERIENGVKKMPEFSNEMIDRFWSKVGFTAIPSKCWEWQDSTSARYGLFSIGSASYKSNRIAYYLHYKKDPLELNVMHSCDNPKCCNPAHLSLGTHWDNMQDMAQKGRARKAKNI